MKIYKTLGEIDENAKSAVIAIGNFDGVHRGHQALLKTAQEIAIKQNKKFGVLTFEPHPRRLFQPDLPPARLTSAPLKAQRLEQNGVECLFSIEFNWDFASQSAEAFIQNVLKDAIGAVHVVVGYDFCFGQLRKGSAQTISDAQIDVSVVDPIKDEKGEIISSSRIRELLRKGKMKEANELLGWDWEVQGTVFRGDRRGHDLGYPTANILLKDTIHPAYGVYACLVQIEGEEEWRAAATNIGIRPMFEVKEGQIEAHILNFPDRDIYDKTLRIKPVERLRGEAKFASLDDLITQIEKDCAQTKKILT
ncbi:MAG: bifunctional riboflavin kinase/FAD synthetase [Alphaproteobacteria bacterium]|nr:bifunctional riboflavin kinase/FAD synthetase [Alphaproteobacteria bacterium]